MQRFIVLASAALMVLSFSSSSFGHMAFKKALGKKYPDMKISCNACHVKGKPKSERNEFGKLFHKQLKEKKITANFKKLEGDDKKKYELEVMIPEFNKALEKIKKMKKKDTDDTYDKLIKAGEMPEIKMKK